MKQGKKKGMLFNYIKVQQKQKTKKHLLLEIENALFHTSSSNEIAVVYFLPIVRAAAPNSIDSCAVFSLRFPAPSKLPFNTKDGGEELLNTAKRSTTRAPRHVPPGHLNPTKSSGVWLRLVNMK